MRTYKTELEFIANDILNQSANAKFNEAKPEYSNRDFINTLIIFQTALMDKMFDLQQKENIDLQDRLNMATKCGNELRNLIKTYTGLDTHKIEEFL